MDDPTDTLVGGVTLPQFAFVRAGLADGLQLDELLGFLRLDPPAWEAAEPAWDERVLDAMEHEELELLQAVDDATEDARRHWSWRIPPLDEDLRAWFDFLHAWLADVEPEAYLRRRGLGAAALAHLHRLWSGRMAQDPALREEAARLLSEERREPPVPAPESPRLARPLRAAPAGENVTADVPVGQGKSLPFAEGEPGTMPPPLAVPLPRRKRPRTTAPGLDETGLGGAAPAGTAVPFVARPDLSAHVAPDTGAAPRPPAEADEHAMAPSAPAPAPPLPEVAPGPARVLEPTLILPVTQAMLAAPVSGARTAVDLDQTAALRSETGAVVPFAEAFRAAGPTPPGLTLRQHAELAAELTTGSDVPSVLARHGLTAEAKKREDERWAAEFRRDPSARLPWMEAFAAARARILSGGQKP